jgi:hypothetical protein
MVIFELLKYMAVSMALRIYTKLLIGCIEKGKDVRGKRVKEAFVWS